jgi:hypothetical protein
MKLFAMVFVSLAVAGCSGESPDAETLSDLTAGQSAKQSVKLFIGPKVDHPGKAPADADEAAGLGRVKATPVIPGRKVSIQWRKAGGGWETQGAHELDEHGYVYFDARPGREYRAKLHEHGNREPLKSEVRTSDWHLVFEDQFSTDGVIDTGVWALRNPVYNPESERRKRSRGDWSAVAVKDGTARLRAIPDPATPKHFLNGHIGTADSGHVYTSGWFAARVKFHSSPGSHAAFWLTNGYATGNAEIDVAEYFGDKRAFIANVYWNWNWDGTEADIADEPMEHETWSIRDGFPGVAWSDEYHVFSVRWEAGKFYQLYVDGRKLATMTGEGVASNPEAIVLSMLTNDGEGEKFDVGGDYVMHVDWVRVWQAGAAAAE